MTSMNELSFCTLSRSSVQVTKYPYILMSRIASIYGHSDVFQQVPIGLEITFEIMFGKRSSRLCKDVIS